MSFEALRWAKEVKLSPTQKLVLLLLADAHNAGKSWPSVATLARQSGLHRSSVLRAIGDLSKAGVLTVERRSGRSSIYRLHLDSTGSTARPVAQRDRSQSATGVVAQRDRTGSTARPRTIKNHKEPELPRTPAGAREAGGVDVGAARRGLDARLLERLQRRGGGSPLYLTSAERWTLDKAVEAGHLERLVEAVEQVDRIDNLKGWIRAVSSGARRPGRRGADVHADGTPRGHVFESQAAEQERRAISEEAERDGVSVEEVKARWSELDPGWVPA